MTIEEYMEAFDKWFFREFEVYPRRNDSGGYKSQYVSAMFKAFRAGKKPQWSPIETAPKDGTVLILFARHRTATASTVVVGSFVEGQWLASSYVGQGEAVIIPSAWMHRPPFPDQSTPA